MLWRDAAGTRPSQSGASVQVPVQVYHCGRHCRWQVVPASAVHGSSFPARPRPDHRSGVWKPDCDHRWIASEIANLGYRTTSTFLFILFYFILFNHFYLFFDHSFFRIYFILFPFILFSPFCVFIHVLFCRLDRRSSDPSLARTTEALSVRCSCTM